MKYADSLNAESQYTDIRYTNLDMASYPRLSDDEAATSLEAARNGDAQARERMIRGNLR
jgi:hypothetical protein